ncbi:site-specific integrase [Rhodomicrobium vannielii ATCC 17100]|uniref:tyrosine-type recombinase/integrase n=1 Tax=Rhodomicrobium vannielii TaxID=1069 RepID=UPI0019181E2D|nr:site-specific integrase [Rhodomicrobium vannielii]MBJ7532941.1 site-specific integrase [Rhodomicrobium vannielii ATCC 17100]
MRTHAPTSVSSLYGRDGARKYLTQTERQKALAAMTRLDPRHALFALTLAWTGARVSEVLALTASSFQVDQGVVAIATLKRRRAVMREVPIPPDLMKALDRQFQLRRLQRDPVQACLRPWPWCRVTAWRIVGRIMRQAGISGRHACPRGLRHAFGVGGLQAGVPLNLLQRWLGHARISTTAIYADACGPEEAAIAQRFWQTGRRRTAEASRRDHGLSSP